MFLCTILIYVILGFLSDILPEETFPCKWIVRYCYIVIILFTGHNMWHSRFTVNLCIVAAISKLYFVKNLLISTCLSVCLAGRLACQLLSMAKMSTLCLCLCIWMCVCVHMRACVCVCLQTPCLSTWTSAWNRPVQRHEQVQSCECYTCIVISVKGLCECGNSRNFWRSNLLYFSENVCPEYVISMHLNG